MQKIMAESTREDARRGIPIWSMDHICDRQIKEEEL